MLILSFVFIFQAKDRGNPPLSSTATVHIIVNDVNDNAPVFNDTYAVQVPENTAVDTNLLRVHASDADVGENGKVRYEIDDTTNFDIDHEFGWLSLRRPLNYEERTQFHLTVTARDSSSDYPRQSAFATVVVSVSDVNEFSPRFPVMMYIESVMEKQPRGTLVFIAKATDLDAGEFGVVVYSIETSEDEIREKFSIDQMSGVVTTGEELFYTEGLHYDFLIVASDVDGRSAQIRVRVNIEPNFEPRFVQTTFDFIVAANARRGDIVGTVAVENADAASSATTGVTFALRPTNEFFAINSTTGVLRVIRDLQSDDSDDVSELRRRRSMRMRWRRALTSNEVTLTVVASVGFPPQTSEATIVITVDRSCPGCGPTTSAIETDGGGGGNVTLVIVIVFVVIAVVIGLVIVGFFFRARSRRARKNKDAARFGPFSPATVEGANHNGVGPPPYNDQFYGHLNGQLTSSDVTVDSQSSPAASSGRGSAEVDVDEDEEIRMINSTQGSAIENRVPPDSGVQDDDAMSEHSVKDHNEYLARLGIDTSKLKSSAENQAQSVESMHQFSDEGGGEGDGTDTLQYNVALPQQKLPLHTNTNQFGFETQLEQNKAGSLSSVINSEEEFSGSYNWDYLLDWGPQYQPLAEVFTEIARLKDDSIKPRKAPTKIVPQSNVAPFSLQTQQQQLRQPPIIIDAPPTHTIQLGQPGTSAAAQFHPTSHSQQKPFSRERKDSSSSSLTANSLARTSQLTSLSNLPKSPISYESSFTATPLSPEFENCLSPLQHHSPTFSPIVSTGHTTPNHAHKTPSLAAHSSGSEQEIHI